MHLLAAQPSSIEHGDEAVDLSQSPGNIIFASAADTELACLARAETDRNAPSLRLANLLSLGHNLSIDNWIETTVRHSQLVIIRLLGGITYWPYGVEQLTEICKNNNILLALLPGDDKPDSELLWRSNLPEDVYNRLWQYCLHGGLDNSRELLRYASHLINWSEKQTWEEPIPFERAGIYRPTESATPIDTLVEQGSTTKRPLALILFYRALLQAGDTNPVDRLTLSLEEKQIDALSVYVSSLKDPPSARFLETILKTVQPDIILNATGFSVSNPEKHNLSPLDVTTAPILQVIFSGSTQEDWESSLKGLSAKDIAMNVALPEVDGRILSRAVSFKSEKIFNVETESSIITHTALPDRIDFVCELAKNWTKLARSKISDRRISIILANYPNKDGRIGNGVGLDTLASVVKLLDVMKDEGYIIPSCPANGQELINILKSGQTNAASKNRSYPSESKLSLKRYLVFFQNLDENIKNLITSRWGSPESDPYFSADENNFRLPVSKLGNIIIAIQPARGYNINPEATYHDPDLPPPHGYLAFYAWIREEFKSHALIHFGKHGNLEWLPGKALALSSQCFPEIALGPLPNIYPFIVNDPGEGSQAKRRTSAVIIDHLTPPLTRAENYGALQEIEVLVDEYYEAANLDPRRCSPLTDRILDIAGAEGIDVDCGILPGDKNTDAIVKLDAYMCELKEMQIRDGLHIFGESPKDSLRNNLLLALMRSPRGTEVKDSSITRALAKDLDMSFDPLDCTMSDAWLGPKPSILRTDKSWRTNGDTVERLENLALALVSHTEKIGESWNATYPVLQDLKNRIAPNLDRCGTNELAEIINALSGKFVAPGPSGAPTRGRPEVLPTGRNFYSLDTRAVPTQSAWQLGWKSAQRLIEHHAQCHGDWPTSIALSAWGTSNMRTGGDDIAQALAFLGARPQWDSISGRVIGFEILPLTLLDRPRVDVTLRISGFFRDAFPALIDLFDSAVRAIAALPEKKSDNPLAHTVNNETTKLIAEGRDIDEAKLEAGWRIFGSKPGAYGAGLQALIDEGGWKKKEDLANAYLTWGSWAYGSGTEGVFRQQNFEQRLSSVQAVVQNQDNREHDLLDSDDYYQFEGGLAATVEVLSQKAPVSYHNDHSQPENPKIRTLEDEIARVVRARVINPKWISGVMRHGYKGAFEMAATVDYLFAFAATTNAVKDHHFDAVFQAYILKEETRNFIENANPDALYEMASRLHEALKRGLWKPKSNNAYELLQTLSVVKPGAPINETKT